MLQSDVPTLQQIIGLGPNGVYLELNVVSYSIGPRAKP